MKSLVHFLVQMWKIILTKNTELFDSAMIQLAEPYYFLDVAIVQQKVNKSIYQKGRW